MRGALEGLRVVDLTMWFQGPVAAQHLADFGAEVIHVERPQGGDLGRGVRSIKALPVGDWNQYFYVINRNKKSLALDLSKTEAREVLYGLVAQADVFLSNLTAENLEKWQVTYEHLRPINPRLVYALCTGYGHFGDVRRPSFDLTVQALTGLMARLGEPGQPPIYAGMGSGDAMGGLLAAFGILAALHARRRSGRGQLIDASLYGAQLFMAAASLQGYLATGDERFSSQRSRRSPANPLWNVYPARDRWLFLCLDNTDENWALLSSTLGEPPILRDPRFTTAEGRRDNATALADELDRLLAAREAGEWVGTWRARGIACATVNTLADLACDPQAWANGYLLEAYSAEVERRVVVRGLPVRLSKTPGSVRALGPELGQHTEEILVETLGYSWDQIGELKEKGAIL